MKKWTTSLIETVVALAVTIFAAALAGLAVAGIIKLITLMF
jgi:hypothetical protein